jgi:hypothetical protein
MSGIGTSLADLDKTVNKSVPGGWVTLGALALGGAGAMGALGGAGGAAGGAGGAGAASGAGAAGAAGGAGAAASSVAAIEGTAAASSLMGTASPFATSAYQAAVPGLTMTGPGSQAAMLAAQTGEFGLQGLASTAGAGGSPFFSALASAPSISPAQAMAAQKMVGGFGQQQGGTQTQTAQFKPGQQVNLADPIASLLAPKRKKERPMISLL